MKKDHETSTNAAELRRRAEQYWNSSKGKTHPDIMESDMLHLVQELQIHQIELELQNEEMTFAKDDADALLERYEDLYDFSPVAYFTLNNQGDIREVNLAGASLLEVDRFLLVNRRLGLYVTPETLPIFNVFLENVFERQGKNICEVALLTETGFTIYVKIQSSISGDGENYRIAVMDITERRQVRDELEQSITERSEEQRDANTKIDVVNRLLTDALAQADQLTEEAEHAKEDNDELSHQVDHDILTGLPNRHCFEQYLHKFIKGSTGKKTRSMVLLFLDLDKFKVINDTLGHKVGDLLLTEVACRLQSCLRSEDMLARMGGDEFIVILPHCNNRSIAQLVASRMIDAISSQFEIQEHRFMIGISIGLASYPSDGTDAVTLLKHADAAMYKSKQLGRGTFCWYSRYIDDESHQRAELEMDILEALEKNQFDVHYQPIVSLADGNIFAVEALLRWDHPEKGTVSPRLIIQIAENIGLIASIGDYVLRKACAQAVAWRDEGIYLSQISVNTSTTQVLSYGWFDSVRAAIKDFGFDARCLNLELTENDFAIDYESVYDVLRKVQDLNISVSISIFGMGQSSLSLLKDFPMIHLKIDGRFVKDIEINNHGNAMIHSIVEMAHGQGIKVIAEWVETESQMDLLRTIGCDFAQGNFISPPLPVEPFAEFVRRWTSTQQVSIESSNSTGNT
jgi:diguanylate cyclase (GGDEF)-like protein